MMRLSVVCLFAGCLLIAGQASGTGLYSISDDVVVLSRTNFVDSVTGSRYAWFVEFYNSWCGHCINFAGTWKVFSTDVKLWQQVMRVGAIDCAEEHNGKTCRHYSVDSYPTLKFFKPYSKENDMGVKFDGATDKVSLRHNFINFVSSLKRSEVPNSWPNLKHLKHTKKYSALYKHGRTTALIFESPWSFVGKEVILDLSGQTEINVRSVEVKKKGNMDYLLPLLFVVNPNGSLHRIADQSKQNLRESFTKALQQLSGFSASKLTSQQSKDASYFLAPKRASVKMSVNELHVYMQDLESGLHYSFRQEIAMRRSISGKALIALKNYTSILAQYFPGRKSVTNYLKKVHKWLEKVMYHITGENWLSKLDELETKTESLPEKVHWTGCQGSEPKYRGYPCSLWMLFHTLTVSVHLDQKAVDASFSPLSVLYIMRNYIHYFFGCNDCSHNFQKMAVTIEEEVKSSKDAVLWLWRAHNKANGRLHGDVSEDPSHLKVQFPPQHVCPKCQLTTGKDDSETKWNKDEVLLFLLNMYKREGIVLDLNTTDFENAKDHRRLGLDWWEKQQQQRDLEKLLELRQRKQVLFKDGSTQKQSLRTVNEIKTEFYVRGARKSNWLFTKVDMGMCMVFYLVCLFLIILLYFHFTRRKLLFKYCFF